MTKSKANTHLNEIGVMRAILILSIVIGHTFAIYGITGSKTWVLPENFESISLFWWINPVFISFTLQAFVFISGYLMRMQSMAKPIKTVQFIGKKIKRLFVPMIVFGLLYWALVDHKMFYNIYDWLNYFMSGPGHLWFLSMLFICFVAMALFLEFDKLVSKSRYNKLIVGGSLLLLYIGSLFVTDDFRIAQFCQYFIYFVLGYWTFDYRRTLKSVSVTKILILGIITASLIAVKLCFIQYKPNHVYMINHMNDLFVGMAGSYLFLLLCMKCPEGTYLSEVGTWTGFFGVYIFHQFILRILYYQTDLLVGLNKYVVGLFALVLTLVLSWALAKLFLNYRLTRKLI